MSESEALAILASCSTTSASPAGLISPFHPNHNALCVRTISARVTATLPARAASLKSSTRLETTTSRLIFLCALAAKNWKVRTEHKPDASRKLQHRYHLVSSWRCPRVKIRLETLARLLGALAGA